MSHSHDHDVPCPKTSAPTDVPNYFLPPPDKAVPFELHAYEALLTVVKAVEFQEYDKVLDCCVCDWPAPLCTLQ